MQPFFARHEFVNAETVTSGSMIESGTVHLRLDRSTMHHGLHEDDDLTSYAQAMRSSSMSAPDRAEINRGSRE